MSQCLTAALSGKWLQSWGGITNKAAIHRGLKIVKEYLCLSGVFHVEKHLHCSSHAVVCVHSCSSHSPCKQMYALLFWAEPHDWLNCFGDNNSGEMQRNGVEMVAWKRRSSTSLCSSRRLPRAEPRRGPPESDSAHVAPEPLLEVTSVPV